jgi:hypothetical protein
VVGYAAGDPNDAWLRRTVLTAAPDGPLETLDQDCNLFGTPDRPRSIDVSGQLVAYGRCVDDGRQEAVVRDYSESMPVEQVIPGGRPLRLRVAGRYVAWLDDGAGQVYVRSGIVVYDRLGASLAYRIPKDAMPGEVHDIDIQDDGKVAFSYAAPGGMKIAWASKSEPSPHTLSLRARASYEVRIARDQIGFEAGRSGGAGEITLADVGIADLSGHARRKGNLAEGSLFSDDFDFDGTRLAWWTYGCTHAFVRVVSAAGAAAINAPRSGCPLRFSRPPSVAGGIVQLHIDCFGFSGEACDTRAVRLFFRRGDRHTIVGRGRSAARVKLTPAGKGLLHRHRRLRVSAVATLSDDGGRREHRAADLILHR